MIQLYIYIFFFRFFSIIASVCAHARVSVSGGQVRLGEPDLGPRSEQSRCVQGVAAGAPPDARRGREAPAVLRRGKPLPHGPDAGGQGGAVAGPWRSGSPACPTRGRPCDSSGGAPSPPWSHVSGTRSFRSAARRAGAPNALDREAPPCAPLAAPGRGGRWRVLGASRGPVAAKGRDGRAPGPRPTPPVRRGGLS